MPHLSDLAAVHLDQPSLVTIGVFDGVHRGHQTLIGQLVTEARNRGRLAVALTFFPHPDVFFHKTTGRYYLTTPDERAALLLAAGIDYVITLPFDEALRQLRAAEFVRQLRDHLRLEALWVGADFALGYKREGDVNFLRAAGDRDGFTVHTIDLLSGAGGAVSSTAIRAALATGDVTAAADLLGRSYHVSGEVVHGQARGRTIGFPTANIAVWEGQVVPANGVYAGWATLAGEPGQQPGQQPKRWMAVTNIGQRPTFAGEGVTVEAHLLDFNRDIYGQRLTFTFERRLRAEQKFSGIDALIAQIHADAAAGRQYLEGLS